MRPRSLRRSSTPRKRNGVLRHKGQVFGPNSILRTGRGRLENRTRHPMSRSTGGPELVPVMDDARLPFLAKFPEGGLDLHPDRNILGFYVDQLRREPDALVHLDDRHHVGLLHLELGRCVVDDRVRDDGPLAAEPETLHLADRLATADRADGPGREVDLPAAPALRPDQVVSALDLAPESGDGHLNPLARRGGRPPWRPSRPACG